MICELVCLQQLMDSRAINKNMNPKICLFQRNFVCEIVASRKKVLWFYQTYKPMVDTKPMKLNFLCRVVLNRLKSDFTFMERIFTDDETWNFIFCAGNLRYNTNILFQRSSVRNINLNCTYKCMYLIISRNKIFSFKFSNQRSKFL